MPPDAVRSKEIAKKPGDVSDLVGLVSVDRAVVFDKGLLKKLGPHPVQSGKAFGEKAVEFEIRLLGGTCLDNHGHHFRLLTGGQLKLEETVRGFLRVRARLDAQVDRSAKIY